MLCNFEMLALGLLDCCKDITRIDGSPHQLSAVESAALKTSYDALNAQLMSYYAHQRMRRESSARRLAGQADQAGDAKFACSAMEAITCLAGNLITHLGRHRVAMRTSIPQQQFEIEDGFAYGGLDYADADGLEDGDAADISLLADD